MKYYILILTILCIACTSSSPIVKEVISADTILLDNGMKVHYAALECPEDNTSLWEQARQANAYLVEGKSIEMIPEQNILESVQEAYIYTPVLVDKQKKYLFVNAEMVRFGFARVKPVAENAREKGLWENLWKLQEQEARPSKRGIWAREKEDKDR